LILSLLLEIVGFFKTNIKIPNQSDWELKNKLKQYLYYHSLGYIVKSCFSCVVVLGQDVLETTRVY